VSIFATLGLGRLGLLAQQRAIQVTSNNIANLNTPGYTRQRAIFEPISPSFLPDGYPQGGGVRVSQVERVVDELLDAQLRQERSAQGFDTAREAGLARIEAMFQELEVSEELGGGGINAALTRFLAAFSDLAEHPADSTVRQGVIQSAAALVGLVRDADRRLAELQTDANRQMEQSVREINDIARDIAELNREIFATEAGGHGAEAASLRDARSQLLEQLAEKVDITSFERADGQVAVFVAGGFLLVDKDTAGALEVRTGASSTPGFFDVYHDLGGSVTGPITSRIASGELGAAIDLRDTTAAGYRGSLDSFAYTLADRVNALHFPTAPATAYGLVDDVQRRFFVDGFQPASAAGTDFTQVAGTAARLAIHADLLADPRHVAAGVASLGAGLGAAPGDGENARALSELAVTAGAFYRTGDVPGAPSGASATLGDYHDGVLGQLGAELQSTRRALQQEELIVAQLEDRRGAVSGVSLDEEISNLIRFERAYQACSRIIQTADSLLERLLDI
jgi:flagellar hook-associated protein 1 FlgK